jgi:hypothetical protein
LLNYNINTNIKGLSIYQHSSVLLLRLRGTHQSKGQITRYSKIGQQEKKQALNIEQKLVNLTPSFGRTLAEPGLRSILHQHQGPH